MSEKYKKWRRKFSFFYFECERNKEKVEDEAMGHNERKHSGNITSLRLRKKKKVVCVCHVAQAWNPVKHDAEIIKKKWEKEKMIERDFKV